MGTEWELIVVGSLAKPLKRAKKALPLILRDFTTEVSDDMVTATREFTPVGPDIHPKGDPHLIDTIEPIRTERTRLAVENRYTGGAKSEKPYASFVEDDTAPHTIDNAFGYIASVHHPGTTGQHMFEKGAAVVEATLEQKAEIWLTAWSHSTGLMPKNQVNLI